MIGIVFRCRNLTKCVNLVLKTSKYMKRKDLYIYTWPSIWYRKKMCHFLNREVWIIVLITSVVENLGTDSEFHEYLVKSFFKPRHIQNHQHSNRPIFNTQKPKPEKQIKLTFYTNSPLNRNHYKQVNFLQTWNAHGESLRVSSLWTLPVLFIATPLLLPPPST